MKQDTDSAVEEAIAWMIGVGSECVNGKMFEDLSCDEEDALLRMCLTPSYVLKKAPADWNH
jgi:hypothetical protein